MRRQDILKEIELLNNKKKELLKDIDEKIKFYETKLNHIDNCLVDKYFSISKDSVFKYSFKECYVSHIHFISDKSSTTTKLLLVKWSILSEKVIISHFEIMTVKSQSFGLNYFIDISKFRTKLKSLLLDNPNGEEEIRLFKLNTINDVNRVFQIPNNLTWDEKLLKIKEILSKNSSDEKSSNQILKNWISTIL